MASNQQFNTSIVTNIRLNHKVARLFCLVGEDTGLTVKIPDNGLSVKIPDTGLTVKDTGMTAQ